MDVELKSNTWVTCFKSLTNHRSSTQGQIFFTRACILIFISIVFRDYEFYFSSKLNKGSHIDLTEKADMKEFELLLTIIFLPLQTVTAYFKRVRLMSK